MRPSSTSERSLQLPVGGKVGVSFLNGIGKETSSLVRRVTKLKMEALYCDSLWLIVVVATGYVVAATGWL